MNIDLKNYKGFAITETQSVESLALIQYCILKDIKYIIVNKKEKCPQDYVPSGSVEWCLYSLDKEIKPNYYPVWLKNYLCRKIWYTDKWPLGQKVFIKPSDRYKRFTGFITFGNYSKKKKPPFVCSEVISFKNEWRYYITQGEVIAKEWYFGDDINMPKAPELNINIPIDFYGTIDFGITDKNQFVLVEAHHPFACGWYGKQHELYFQWLIDGWKYMQDL
jgi:hypothetical protein